MVEEIDNKTMNDSEMAKNGTEESAAERVEAQAEGTAQRAEDRVGESAEARAEESAVAEFLDRIAQLEAELAEARQECAGITEKSQRLAAEFQNSRRRQERQLAEEMERVSAHMLRRILPALDDFELAFANLPNEEIGQTAWVEGFRQIQRKLRGILEDEGVVKVAGEGLFDPTLHEAIASSPSEEVESGHIVETLRAGYTLKGQVLRPALVRIAS